MIAIATEEIPVTIDAPWTQRAKSLAAPLFCLWMLSLLTFSMPGRESPEGAAALDPIGLAKVGARGLTLALLAYVLLRQLGTTAQRAVGYTLFPLALYVCWAFFSAAWSPLKTVSIGQAGGLAAQVMLAAAIGILWSTERDTSRILKHLSLILLTISSVILASDFIDHDLSGLNREVTDAAVTESTGLFHPTAAGSTAALGLVIIIVARLLWNWPWTRLLLAPALVIHTWILLLAASRMALGMTVVVIGLAICALMDRRVLGTITFFVCAAALAYLIVDPRMEFADESLGLTSRYLSRGESAESLTSLTGRTELWDAMWKSFQDSPILGHGYFVTSKTGAIDVWGGPENRTAHNVLLQVLVTTGLVGLFLVLWGFGRIGLQLLRTWYRDDRHHRLIGLLALMALWYFGWGLLSESFFGTVAPESTVFYTMLGLALAVIANPRTAAQGAPM